MAINLDHHEQEQLDAAKAYWGRYGNLITAVITLALLAFAGMNGWNWWQRQQAGKASAMYEELDRAVVAGEPDRAARLFGDLKSQYGRTIFAAQGGLITAKLLATQGKVDEAISALQWVADGASDDDYRALAHFRLAGLLLDKKQFDQALQQLDAVKSTEMAGLASDRRGDILAAQGKTAEAVVAWTSAWKAMDKKLNYRQVVEAKLMANGAAPEATSTDVAASGVAK